jgi:hypothetical protein
VKISKTAVEKIAQFIISKGPATAAEYLESLRKIMAAKEADKAKVLAKALKSPAVKPRGPAKPRKKKQTPLYGMPTGHGTAAFRFGD